MLEKTVIKVENVSKSYQVGVQEISILKDISFEIKKSDFSIIFGPSGCGKSTLLHGILGLEAPTKGKIFFLDKNLYLETTEDDLSDFRKTHIGMVYQQPNWIKSLSVIENIAFPQLLIGKDRATSMMKAKEILNTVGMIDWADYVPTELSSGQQQRIALARALVSDPEVIIADEPTGNLDFESGQILMELLTDLNKKQSKTIVMVTHDLEYLKYSKTAIRMFDGKIIGTYQDKNQEKLLKDLKTKRGNNYV